MLGRTYLETAQALAKLLVQQKVPCLLTDYSREAVRDPSACLLPQTSVELSSELSSSCRVHGVGSAQVRLAQAVLSEAGMPSARMLPLVANPFMCPR